MTTPPEIHRADARGIPVIWARGETRNSSLVIWLPGFGGTKEGCEPQIRELASWGFTAISFDPFQHGERSIESPGDLSRRILGNIRMHFWPILAQTSRDVPVVIDWAEARLRVTNIGMGGISMGGDITVAAMGLDHRIGIGTPCIATPDWLRPGSIEQPGAPDDAAASDYLAHDPITNTHRYRHCPRIHFQNGGEDAQVPAEASIRFREALRNDLYRNCPERIEATVHPDTSHRFTDAMWAQCMDCFDRWL